METSSISIDRIDEAMKLTRDIQSRANEIEHELYQTKKKLDKLKKKKQK